MTDKSKTYSNHVTDQDDEAFRVTYGRTFDLVSPTSMLPSLPFFKPADLPGAHSRVLVDGRLEPLHHRAARRGRVAPEVHGGFFPE